MIRIFFYTLPIHVIFIHNDFNPITLMEKQFYFKTFQRKKFSVISSRVRLKDFKRGGRSKLFGNIRKFRKFAIKGIVLKLKRS